MMCIILLNKNNLGEQAKEEARNPQKSGTISKV